MAKKASTLQIGLVFETSEDAPPAPPGAVAVAKEPKGAKRPKPAEPRVTAPPATNADTSRRKEADEEDAGLPSAKRSQPGNLPLACVQCGRVFNREEARFVYESLPGRSHVIETGWEADTRERPRYVATCLVAQTPGEPPCREVFQARLDELEVPARIHGRQGSRRR